MRKWRPSKTAAREFAAKMREIEGFCDANGITSSLSSDSYYFALNGKHYRVSNHSIEASNRGAWRENPLTGESERVREDYHEEDEGLVCIHASKTRIVEIYNDLKAGYELDGRGRRK